MSMKRFGLLTFSVLAMSGLTAVTCLAEPVPVKREAPEYPRGAERRKIEGHVVVKFTIQASGDVAGAQVVEATPPGVFDDAAIKAISKWKYEKTGADMPDQTVKLSFKP